MNSLGIESTTSQQATAKAPDASASNPIPSTPNPSNPNPSIPNSGTGSRSLTKKRFQKKQRGDADRPKLRSHLKFRDLMAESIAGLEARPARSILTVLGTVLGITALVATLGVSRTAGNQIVARFDAFAATEVSLQPASGGGGAARSSTIPWNAEARLMRLNGVIAAGTLTQINTNGALSRTTAVQDATAGTEFDIPLRAASPGLFAAVKTKLRTGRVFDSGSDKRADNVAVLGPGAAERLGLNRIDQQPAVFVGDRLFVVIGIIDDVARQADLLDSIIIPEGTAREIYNLPAPQLVAIDTSPGAAALVAKQAATALDPNDPSRLRTASAGGATRVKDEVSNDLSGLFLILGGVSLLVGAIGIANVTLVSVMERIGEIGLRRALGAGRRHIIAQFLTESTFLGLLGGAVGAALGVLVTVGISAIKQWTPVMDGRIPFAAPALGAIVGLLAGLYPAMRAASLQPVEALRAGT
jgi:putative ABC transport system permease protein